MLRQVLARSVAPASEQPKLNSSFLSSRTQREISCHQPGYWLKIGDNHFCKRNSENSVKNKIIYSSYEKKSMQTAEKTAIRPV
jgi:hypothetical protein